MTETKHLRKIQSFVKRSGRLSKGQSLGLNELWTDYGINVDKTLLNFEEVFGNQSEVTLEVGFGNGDSLLEMAIHEPGQNFLGIEVYEAGVGRLVNEASKKSINNLRVIRRTPSKFSKIISLMEVFPIFNYFFLILGTKRGITSVELYKRVF